jgi:hypothetical protein
VLEAGLHGAYVTVDDTCARHAGKSGYTTQIGADTFTVFRTGPSKSRLAFLSRLCGSTASYVINDAALGYMRTAASYPDHPDQGQTGPAVWILSGPRPGYGPERASPVCPPAARCGTRWPGRNTRLGQMTKRPSPH